MRILISTMVALAVLATAFVSVRLHHDVAALRYRLWDLEEQRDRADRELRLAAAEYEGAKSPRTLFEQWSRVRSATPDAAPAVDPAARSAAPASPASPAAPAAPTAAPERDPEAGFAADALPEEGR